MNRNEIGEKLVAIMRDLFDDDTIQYSDTLSADDIEEWDSLSHVRFIVAVEREFSVRFSTSEIESIESVGSLVDTLEHKIAD